MPELRWIVAKALDSVDYLPADSGRIRAVPDIRTIRYYTTLGLIDKPAEMVGRTALYNAKHVYQLVAIKRLQSEDLTLSDIQKRLYGLPDKKLQEIAQIPSSFWDGLPALLAEAKGNEGEKGEVANRTYGLGGPSAQNTVQDMALNMSQNVAESSDVPYWLEVPKVPNEKIGDARTSDTQEGLMARVEKQLRISLHAQVTITIKLDDGVGVRETVGSEVDVSRIVEKGSAILEELKRMGWINDRFTTD